MKQFEALTRKKDNQAARYLIVDDSVFARKSLAKMVESFGGQVVGEAGDGCTAITEYARTKPDIVLMDITMPQMEGIEAVERIVQEHPDARIVMVSSVGYQDNILAALQKGARHFVQKPVKPDALYEREPLRRVFQDRDLAKAVSEGRKKEYEGFLDEGFIDPQSQEAFDSSKLDWREVEEPQHQELLKFHRDLLALRKHHKSLSNCRKDLTRVEIDEEKQILRMERSDPAGSRALLVCNFGPASAQQPTENLPVAIQTKLADGGNIAGHSAILYLGRE